MNGDAYELLAAPLRQILWEMGWDGLRPIQQQAIRVILESDHDLLISARTASGKTEAAFLPVLSRIHESPVDSIQAMYIGPLRALINDQFRRLEDLCLHADIPVHRWHGDVPAGQKRRLLSTPSGVLLITPESLESLFINHSPRLAALFHGLSFVVIDELHAMIGTERGTHLRSLLCRVDRMATDLPRLISLSATMGDTGLSAKWMRPDAVDRVVLLEDIERKPAGFRLHGYLRRHPSDATKAERDYSPPATMTADLYEAFHGSKGLIFANSRSDVEWFGSELNDMAHEEFKTRPFLVHHGSLGKEIREHTESRMQSSRAHTTLCTSSLELGIDIGSVAAVGQIGCPWSVASMIQRLGRSGREEGATQNMRVYVADDEPAADTHLVRRLHPELLQAIALTELMREKWVEPPVTGQVDLSTLVQQILSVLAETGGMRASELGDRLITNGAFNNIDFDTFAALLRAIGQRDLIEQVSGGDLILGLEGERIVNHYTFYSAFATPPEYRVIHGGEMIGTLPIRYIPSVGDHIILAARRWQVTSIDDDRRELAVQPGRGRQRPKFQGSLGDVHQRVRQQMRSVLIGETMFDYMTDEAQLMLQSARKTAAEAGMRQGDLIATGPSQSLWFPWVGSRGHETLVLLADHAGHNIVDHGIAIECTNRSPAEFARAMKSAIATTREPIRLASRLPVKQRRKYDEFLTEELLTHSLAADVIDLDSAAAAIRDI